MFETIKPTDLDAASLAKGMGTLVATFLINAGADPEQALHELSSLDVESLPPAADVTRTLAEQSIREAMR